MRRAGKGGGPQRGRQLPEVLLVGGGLRDPVGRGWRVAVGRLGELLVGLLADGEGAGGTGANGARPARLPGRRRVEEAAVLLHLTLQQPEGVADEHGAAQRGVRELAVPAQLAHGQVEHGQAPLPVARAGARPGAGAARAPTSPTAVTALIYTIRRVARVERVTTT